MALPVRTIIGAVAAAVVAAGAAVVVRRRRGAGPSMAPPPPAGSAPDERPAQERVRAVFHHDCGQELRVSGEGRHRVVWLPDAPMDQPLLDDRCPGCGEPLAPTTA